MIHLVSNSTIKHHKMCMEITGLEPMTLCLQSKYSTTELYPQKRHSIIALVYLPAPGSPRTTLLQLKTNWRIELDTSNTIQRIK